MSLRVWLPLTGDLHNQGISDTTVNSNSLTVDTNGKIGQCYRFTSSNNSNITLTPALWDNNTDEMSFCCWIKMASFSAATLFCNRSETASTGFAAWIMNASQLYFDTGERWTINLSAGLSFVANQWYHICFTYSKSKNIKAVYINGQRTAGTAGTAPTKATATATYIGTTQTGTGNPLNGWMNDVRLYDHCLSSAEVSEIARGLALHYKLDEGNENLLLDMPKSHSPTAYNAYQFDMKENLVAGQTYTIQLWNVTVEHSAKTAAQMNLQVYWGGGNVRLHNFNGSTNFTILRDHYAYSPYLCAQITPTEANASGSGATNAWLNIYNSVSNADGTRNMKIGAWKLEKGAAATQWVSSDADMTKIQDSSGYNHNGITVGNPTILSSSPRYGAYTSFDGSNDAINAGLDFEVEKAQNFTFCAWIYSDRWNTGVNDYFLSSQESGGFLIRALDSNKIRVRVNAFTAADYSTNSYIDADATLTSIGATAAGWHFVAGVYTTSDLKLYVDGVLQTTKTITTYGLHFNSSTNLYLGAECAGSKPTPFCKCGLSDVRIYYTSLLDTDIKQLYNVGMKIDKFGNMHPYEVQENNDMMINAKFVNNSATSVSYDEKTDTYTIVSPVGTSSWGYGVRLADTPALMVPYGATYRWTAEVWTPIALNINTDYNNTAGGTDVNWAGNDNDATGTRLASIIAIPANKWTRIYRGASNTNNGNTNHLPIRDYSSLGLVTNGQSNPVTWKIRHLQWYIADTEFKPQMKSAGIFEASHFTETEEDLNKPAQISKKMFSVNATQFIER